MSSIVTDAPATAAVITGTAASSAAGLLDLIPDDISKLSAVVCICLSLVLIYYHIKIGNAKLRQMELDQAKSEAEV